MPILLHHWFQGSWCHTFELTPSQLHKDISALWMRAYCYKELKAIWESCVALCCSHYLAWTYRVLRCENSVRPRRSDFVVNGVWALPCKDIYLVWIPFPITFLKLIQSMVI